MRGNIKAARKMLKRNRGRSYLTMLGTIIGVASVITIASIGQGIKHQVTSQINHFGPNLITIRPGEASTTTHNRLQILSGLHVSGSLSDRDLTSVRQVAKGAAVVPLAVISGTTQADHGAYRAGPVIATSDQFASVMNQSISYGSFFSSDDAASNYAVIGQRAAQRMFNAQVPLGQTFSFRGQQFMVRGIFNAFPSVVISSDVDYNDAIFIPYTVGQQLTNNSVQPYELLVKPDSAAKVPATISAITQSLLKNHGDSSDFTVEKAADSVATTSSVLDLLTELVTGAAAISLIVGGIGIMNITFVSVTERMREIGIRKAVGATDRQILNEFMAESIVISVTGAIIGIFVAAIIVGLLRLLTSMTPVIQWQIVLLAAGFSMLIGIIFGTAPALKAARKDPIAALRGE